MRLKTSIMWNLIHLLKWNLGLVLVGLIMICNIYAQHGQNPDKTAKVIVIMPLVSGVDENSLPGGHLDFEIFLVSSKDKKKLKFVSRDFVGESGNHIDKFEINVSPGFYKLTVKGYKQYKLPNFHVAANENYVFHLPKDRLIQPEVCMNEEIYSKILQKGESFRDYERRYREHPFHRVETEIVRMDDSLEMVVQYCRKYEEGTTVRYRSARIYYKNFYVTADDVLVDRKLRRIEALARRVEVEGVEQQIMQGKLEFTY